MPEGHKTHWFAKLHQRLLGGEKLVVSSPQGRFAEGAALVDGRRLVSVSALGKLLFYEFTEGHIVHVHLGRYGQFRTLDSPPTSPVGLVRMRMQGSSVTVDLNGPSVCRVVDAAERDHLCSQLGPDPLAGGRRQDVWNVISQSSKPIAALLLDQSVIAGVGNIFRAEMLHEAKLDPLRRGIELTSQEFTRLWKVIVRQMRAGLKLGRIVTWTAREAGRPLAGLEGHDRFRVYSRSHCGECAGDVSATQIAGRTLYVCAPCQASSEAG